MSGIFRFSPSDMGQSTVSGGDVANAFMGAYFKSNENLRQNQEADRQAQRFPMEQQRFADQQEETIYQRTLRPLKEQQMRLGLASDVLTIQTQGADLTFKQGQIRAQGMEIAANEGVLGAFQSNEKINKGIGAAMRIYGGGQNAPAVAARGAPPDENVNRALGMFGAGNTGLPAGTTGADAQNPLLPNPDGSPTGVVDDSSPPAPRATPVQDVNDHTDLADAYLEAQDIVQSMVTANGGRQTPAITAAIKQFQSIQLAALANPETKRIVELKQAEKIRVQMQQDIAGLPLGVREYLTRVIPEPAATNPQAVLMARESRMLQVQNYYKNPSEWLSSHGITTKADVPTLTPSQWTTRVESWRKAATEAVGEDPAKVRQINVIAQQALLNPSTALPVVAASPVTAPVAKPAARLDITSYYEALRRAAGDDEEEIARLSFEEAAMLRDPSKFRGGGSSAAAPGGVVPPSTRFQTVAPP